MSEISRESKQQRRESSARKSRTKKVNASHLEKESPYEDSGQDNSEHEMSDDRRIPEITTEELQSAISKLQKGKSPDSNGIRAEDIKACDDETRNDETDLQRDHKEEQLHT